VRSSLLTTTGSSAELRHDADPYLSLSSRRSSALAYESRLAVLNFFDADPEEYAVIFTPNATGALKMVGESFPFAGEDSTILLPVDAHNSVHGLRVFAESHGARVLYYGCGERGGVDMDDLKVCLTHSLAEQELARWWLTTGVAADPPRASKPEVTSRRHRAV